MASAVEHGNHELQVDGFGEVTELGIADDGRGISPEKLSFVLSLGYSSRYGSRSGLGWFGMGLKLASLSQARRVEVFTKPVGDKGIFSTYLDLDEVREKTQLELSAQEVPSWPDDFADLMKDSKSGKEFGSGTLIVWRKMDRLSHGCRFKESTDERIKDTIKFLARAYRRFIDKGSRIEFDGQEIFLHDPLFLLENPRVIKKFEKGLQAQTMDTGSSSLSLLVGAAIDF